MLPEFIQLYQSDTTGKLIDEYEPIRMAVQLYSQAYEVPHWKARHILWWAAIESLYGNNEDAVIARIYAFFGNKEMGAGLRRSIYEKGDIPPCFPLSQANDHTLAEVIPLVYRVRNESAHGQKVPDPRFAEFRIRWTAQSAYWTCLPRPSPSSSERLLLNYSARGFRDKFKDRDSREEFWLLEYG